MTVTLVNGLPSQRYAPELLTLVVRGPAAFVRSPNFVARFCLESGEVDWLVERSCPQFAEGTVRPPRWIWVLGLDLWVDRSVQHVCEILPTECGDLTVHVRHAKTGQIVWERYVPIPPAAHWAEQSPIRPGYQTEELYAFIAEESMQAVGSW